MAKRRRKSVKIIPLTIGQDPSLWRYGSVHEALEANTGVLSELIRASQDAQSEQQVISERANDDNAEPIAAR